MSTVEGFGDKGVRNTNMSLVTTTSHGSGLGSMWQKSWWLGRKWRVTFSCCSGVTRAKELEEWEEFVVGQQEMEFIIGGDVVSGSVMVQTTCEVSEI